MASTLFGVTAKSLTGHQATIGPRFMAHLADVDTTTNGRSRWTVKGPLGLQVQWEAEIIADEPGRLIAWKSRPVGCRYGGLRPLHRPARWEGDGGPRGVGVRVGGLAGRRDRQAGEEIARSSMWNRSRWRLLLHCPKG